jgi:hypothetical protein
MLAEAVSVLDASAIETVFNARSSKKVIIELGCMLIDSGLNIL